ncbi:hypothetical protein H0H87_010066, partial [Tephrocybe sp. NHM501043]
AVGATSFVNHHLAVIDIEFPAPTVITAVADSKVQLSPQDCCVRKSRRGGSTRRARGATSVTGCSKVIEGWMLVAIPIAAHKNAKKVVSLKLSGNPMLEILLNFFQSCTSLLNLRLSYMTLKSIPKSVRHTLALRWLDFSSNHLSMFEEASLNWNAQLQMLCLQNNRIEGLLWYFPQLRGLTTLNISNNKFCALPLSYACSKRLQTSTSHST